MKLGTAAGVAPARACAYRVVRRVFEQGAYADRALHAEAASLSVRDRRLAMALAYGTVQRRATLDHVADRLSSRPLEELDPPVLAALRLGLFQLLLLDGVADHAAVNDSVELAKPAGASLVNAVLRRAASEGQAILDELDDETPARAAVLHSIPRWIAQLWWGQLGPEQARALMRRCNEPAESALRVNALVSSTDEVTHTLPVASHPAPGLPEGLVLDGPFDAHGSDLFERGAIMPQSRGSMRVARMLAPQPGERVLDLCAAPGAKTTHLAALTGGEGEVVAVERNPRRAQALASTCARMHAQNVRIDVADAAGYRAGRRFDRVLVDPPCSGLGTLQSRPDLRWRASSEAIEQLAALQRCILMTGAEALRRGGALVYSVCTVSRAESSDVVEAALEADRALKLEEQVQLLPHRDGTDGFFIARLRRYPKSQ
jgi:16S rRNA (cytosine967-C5)-methyltransferase